MKNVKDIYMYLLGAFVVGAACGVIVLLISHELPTNNKDVVNIALGALLGMAGSVVNYFYGSSKSSAEKTEIIKEQNAGQP